MDKIEMLHNICEVLTDEMEDVSKKLEKAGGMSAGDLETVDKLAHALKSIKTTIAMMESEGGYSGRYYPMGGMAYNDGRSYNDGMSYARNRDSMGRYSRRGYSRAEDGMQELIGEMRDMMGSLPDDKRREVQRFIDRMS